MRRFRGPDGRSWDAVVGRESWGAFFAIFAPVAAGAEIRQAQLQAGSWTEAEHELDALDETALQELLGRSTHKTLE